MVNRLVELPPALNERPFTVREGRSRGLSRTALDHPRFDRLYHGARAPAQKAWPVASEFERRVLAFAPLLREGEVFGYETALRWYGCPIRMRPYPIEAETPVDRLHMVDPVHVVVPWPRNARRAAGVIGHKTKLEFTPWVTRDGVRLAPPLVALAQAAETLPVPELVVAADHLARARSGLPHLGLDEARAEAAKLCSPGVAKLRRGLELSRESAQSREETLLRLLLEAFGLARYFSRHVELRDTEGVIGRFRFVSERHSVIIELGRERHLSSRDSHLQYVRGLERARNAGYRLVRVHTEELHAKQAALAASIAAALGRPCMTVPRFPELLVS